jgi:hypothetical protein
VAGGPSRGTPCGQARPYATSGHIRPRKSRFQASGDLEDEVNCTSVLIARQGRGVDENILYNQALAAIEAGDRELARRLLAELVRRNARHEQGWLRLASVVDDRRQIGDCLQRVLALNPDNITAAEWLEQIQQPGSQTSELQVARAGKMLDDDVQLAEPGDEERPVPRLGQYLLDYQFISADQLKAALMAQRSAISSGRPRRLGDILLELGALSADRLNFAVREQHRSFYSLFDE